MKLNLESLGKPLIILIMLSSVVCSGSAYGDPLATKVSKTATVPQQKMDANSKLETLAQMEAAITKDPQNIAALMALGDYHMRNHNITQSVGYFDRVLKIHPNDLKVLRISGKLKMMQHRWKEAATNFSLLGKLAPSAEVFSDDGDAKFLMNDRIGAAGAWLECANLAPDVPAYLERAGYGNYLLEKWSSGAACFDKAWQSKVKPTSWPQADASLAYVGYGMAGNKDLQGTVLKNLSQQKPADVDLFDSYTIDYLSGKINFDTYAQKKGNDPYYAAQVNFFSGFNLIGQGKIQEGRALLNKCNMQIWAATDDFKLPFGAIAKNYLAVKK